LVSNGFSTDRGDLAESEMLDVAGLSTATPQLISDPARAVLCSRASCGVLTNREEPRCFVVSSGSRRLHRRHGRPS